MFNFDDWLIDSILVGTIEKVESDGSHSAPRWHTSVADQDGTVEEEG